MIIHLPKNISRAYVQELADHVGALCLEKTDHFVLITNHTVKHNRIHPFALVDAAHVVQVNGESAINLDGTQGDSGDFEEIQ